MDFHNIFQMTLKKVKTLKSVFFGVQKSGRAIYQNLYKICAYDIIRGGARNAQNVYFQLFSLKLRLCDIENITFFL